ncbi:hypothetical protein ABFZ85_14340 [Hyphococcus formosus]|uniref:hypothetical protein n=1 Tax=Hyphococcus formosus TaxID=3143534 RepID=UPI00398A6454
MTLPLSKIDDIFVGFKGYPEAEDTGKTGHYELRKLIILSCQWIKTWLLPKNRMSKESPIRLALTKREVFLMLPAVRGCYRRKRFPLQGKMKNPFANHDV